MVNCWQDFGLKHPVWNAASYLFTFRRAPYTVVDEVTFGQLHFTALGTFYPGRKSILKVELRPHFDTIPWYFEFEEIHGTRSYDVTQGEDLTVPAIEFAKKADRILMQSGHRKKLEYILHIHK